MKINLLKSIMRVLKKRNMDYLQKLKMTMMKVVKKINAKILIDKIENKKYKKLKISSVSRNINNKARLKIKIMMILNHMKKVKVQHITTLKIL